MMSVHQEHVLRQVSEGKRWLVGQDVREAALAAHGLSRELGRLQYLVDSAKRDKDKSLSELGVLRAKLALSVEENSTLREQLAKAETDANSLVAEIKRMEDEAMAADAEIVSLRITQLDAKGHTDQAIRLQGDNARLERENRGLGAISQGLRVDRDEQRSLAENYKSQLKRIADLTKGFLPVELHEGHKEATS